MDTSAKNLRCLKQKYDEERNTNEKRETLWKEKHFSSLQRMVIDSATRGKDQYYDYIDFDPSSELLVEIHNLFPECEIMVEEDYSLTKLIIKWKEEERNIVVEEEEVEEEVEEESEEEEADIEESAYVKPPKPESPVLHMPEELASSYRFWKSSHHAWALQPEWVKNIEEGHDLAIPDRQYSWQTSSHHSGKSP